MTRVKYIFQCLFVLEYFLTGMLQPFNLRNWPEALCTLLCGSIIKRKDLTTFILHFLG